MKAIHSLDMEQVKKTATYKELAMGLPEDKMEKMVEHMFEFVRATRAKKSEREWAGMMAVIEEQAILEEMHGGESITVVDDAFSQDRLKLDNNNPRQ